MRSISYRTDALNRRTFARGYINDRSEPSYLQRFYYDGFEAARIDESSTLGALRARNWQTYSAVIDDLLAITPKAATGDGPGSASYYAHTDHQGSVRAITDDAAAIANQYDYDSYGNRLAAVESLPQPFGYTGRRIARSTGLYYYRFRDYDPATGRFLQEDPLYFGAGDNNLYRYTWNNPVNWVDPSGMFAGSEDAMLREISGKRTAKGAGPVGAGIAAVLLCAADAIGHWGGPCDYLFGGGGGSGGPPPVLGPKKPGTGSPPGGNSPKLPPAPQPDKPGIPDPQPAPAGGGAGAPGGPTDPVVCTGEKHHVFSARIMKAINRHQVLRGQINRNDYITQGRTPFSHRGYFGWHEKYDRIVVRWLDSHKLATKEEFFRFIRWVYNLPMMKDKFPNGPGC